MVDTNYVRDKVVLITGAAGTIGSALAEKIAPLARSVRCFDHAETELFFLNQRLRGKGQIAPQLGDIRDLDRLRFAMAGVDVVFHTAALKHVGLGEYNPFEVVQTNLQGVNNVIRAALDSNVDRVVFTSSDKSVNPTNVFAIGLIVVGAAMVISAWVGRSFILIPIGLLLIGLMSVSTVIDVPFRGGIGEKRVDPFLLSDLHEEYHHGIGEMRLDLTHVDFPRGTTTHLKATVGIGHLRIAVPRDVTVVLHGHAGMGEVRFLDDHEGGFDVNRDVTLPSTGESTPRLDIDADIGIGQIEVTDAAS